MTFNIDKHSLTLDSMEDGDGIIISTSNVYTYVNELKGPEWFDHRNFKPDWREPNNYFLVKKVGHGKYSTVYKSTYQMKNFLAIKVLVPLSPNHYLREIKVLLNLKDGPNIVKLLDLIVDPLTGMYSLVFEWVDFYDWQSIYSELTNEQIKIILYKVLKAVHYSHCNGIMHRDIKPQNIAIDPTTLKVRLLDWGLADFYFPRRRYSSHVATRMFKSPELLIEYPYYDYSVDIWALGLTFAMMLFGRSPIHCGEKDDNEDQLKKVADFVGGRKIINYAESLKVKLSPELISDLVKRGKKGISGFVERYAQNVPADAIDLLKRMMTIDHRQRITAADALKHDYFASIRK